MNYDGFLHGKVVTAPESGMDVKPEELSKKLKPHQRDAVIWALKGGRRGLFESFGLGKTAQELEYCRLIVKRQGGKALIVLPLGVRQEFKRDAVELLGMVPPEYVRSMEEAEHSNASILMTNYERVRDGDIDPRAFTATVLDEASVLRSFGSKTYQTFLDKFQGVPYKLVCTATPSPNRYKELIHYAGFLEVMDTGQALTRFFQRDSTKANNLTLYPHKEKEFWLWVSTWALMITKPSDLGYSDEGYALPPLKVVPHVIRDQYGQSVGRDGQVELLRKAVNRLQEVYRKYSRESVYDYAQHVELAKELDRDGRLPATFMVVAPGSWTDEVWDDINRMRTLNTTQSQRRKQMHVCPLQLDIVDRIINRYSNPGDLVLDPFGGLGTVALEAIKAGRRGYTIELNNDYFRDAVGYLKEQEEREDVPTLFDFLEGSCG